MIRLRQIAFATSDLAAGEAALSDALHVERCFQDPGVLTFGLANALFPIGDQFLEIVSPVQEHTTAGRQLDKRGGDCGYMVLFQVDDLAPVETRLADLGIRVVFDARERTTSAGCTSIRRTFPGPSSPSTPPASPPTGRGPDRCGVSTSTRPGSHRSAA